jgi:hypothetical protein
VIQATGHHEAIEVAQKAPSFLGARITCGKPHLDWRIPPDIDAADGETANIETSVDRYLERHSSCVSSDQESLPASWAIFQRHKPHVRDGSEVRRPSSQIDIHVILNRSQTLAARRSLAL